MGMRFIYLVIGLGLIVKMNAQPIDKYPKGFHPPLDIPLLLAGNFAELRLNHFHGGIDIKTQGIEGLKIYAVEDGYVSRIKISLNGYGKVLYLTHPNGYTSVYAHLQKFGDNIEHLVKKTQYAQKSYTIELFPNKDELSFKKGQVIAYSGNSGGSTGPHLHFEFRETDSEAPLNPLLFGFDIKDNIPPVIHGLAIYPLSDSSSVNGSHRNLSVFPYKINNSYIVKNEIIVNGPIGVGIQTDDMLNGASNKNGIYSIELKVDDTTIFKQEMEKVPFYETRYVNALVDYEAKILKDRWIYQSFVDENNKLSIYPKLKNRGIIDFSDNKSHRLTYIVTDSYGLTSTLDFTLKHNSHLKAQKPAPSAHFIEHFKYNHRNFFKNDEITVNIPPNALYEDIDFEYHVDSLIRRSYSATHHIHKPTTPLHAHMIVSFHLPDAEPELKDKMVIISTDGESIDFEGGTWRGDDLSIRTRSFGGFAVMVDTVPPRIRPLNIEPNAYMGKKWSISCKVTDAISEIETYNGFIDGEWVLMEYDQKKDLLIHYFDERTTPGNHHFKFEATDGAGNKSFYEANFIR